MDSDARRSENDKCNASSLWVNGLWDKAKRRQKLRRHCCFGVCISGHSLVRSTKLMQCEWCQSTLDDCAWLFVLCLFTINFILHSDSSLHTFFEDLLDKTPKCALFSSTPGNEPRHRSEEAFVSPSWSFLPDHLCCTGFPPNWGKGWKSRFQLSSGDPRPCPQTCFEAAVWSVVLLAAAHAFLQLIIVWRVWMVLDPWAVAHTLVLDPGANWWAWLPFLPPFSL